MHISLILVPVSFILLGLAALVGSFGEVGVEKEGRWIWGVRGLGVIGIGAGIGLGRKILNGRRKGIDRTVLILEVSLKRVCGKEGIY